MNTILTKTRLLTALVLTALVLGFVTRSAAAAAPVAINDRYTTPVNLTLIVNDGGGVLGNDSDPDGDALQPILADGTSFGTLTL
jgi:hypothetical protein